MSELQIREGGRRNGLLTLSHLTDFVGEPLKVALHTAPAPPTFHVEPDQSYPDRPIAWARSGVIVSLSFDASAMSEALVFMAGRLECFRSKEMLAYARRLRQQAAGPRPIAPGTVTWPTRRRRVRRTR